MHLAIENSKGNIGFFGIDGRHLQKFIAEAKQANKNLVKIWSYTDKKQGQFINIKTIWNK